MITKRMLWSRACAAVLLFANVAWFDGDYPRTVRETVIVSPRTLDLVKSHLASPDPSDRARALGALRQVRDPSLAQAVKGVLDDPDPQVRSEALLTLESLLSETEIVPVLESKCSDGSPAVVRQALGILGDVKGPDAFAALSRVGTTLSPAFLEDWSLALARRDEPVESNVIERLLDSANRSARVAAMRIVLRRPGVIEQRRRVELLSDPNPWIRAQAIVSLADDKNDPAVRMAIVDRLSDPSGIVRRSALEWIESTGVELSVIDSYLEDDDGTVRAAAVRVAGKIATPEAVTKLIHKLSDKEVLVARAATEQLAAIASETVTAALINALTDQRDQVASEAARCLGLRRSGPAVDALQTLANHTSVTVRSAAYEAIGAIGDPRVVPWLLERVGQERGYPRAAINQALGRLNAVQGISHLIADCQYPDKESKGLIPSLFGPMGGPPPYPAPDTAVAAEAARALGELGAIEAVPVLINVSRDVLRNERFWTAVAASLGKLGDPRARDALVQYATIGMIVQGMMGVDLPTTTRIEALRSISKLNLTDTVDAILQMQPHSSNIPLRQAAAEVLTELTGVQYTYRLPMRLGSFFIEDRGETVDLSPFKLPICYRVDAP